MPNANKVSNKEILRKANEAIARGDIEGFLEHCTDDTAWTFVGDRVLQGKEAVRQWMRQAYRKPPKFTIHEMVAEGDVVVALGEILLEDASGNETEHRVSDVWRFENGRMAALNAFVIEREKRR